MFDAATPPLPFFVYGTLKLTCEVATAGGPRRAWVYVVGVSALALIRAGAMRRIAGGVWAA